MRIAQLLAVGVGLALAVALNIGSQTDRHDIYRARADGSGRKVLLEDAFVDHGDLDWCR